MSGSPESDADLIARSLDDPEAFRELFSRYFEAVRRYTQRVVGLDAGEELAAKTFLVAFEKRETFALMYPSARPWLFGIAHNMVRHHLRAAKRQETALTHVSFDAQLSDVLDDESLTAAWVTPYLVGALRALHPEERECFLLVALGDLSYEETATILEIPMGTVRSRIHRVRAKLRELLPDLRETTDEGREHGRGHDAHPKDPR